MPVQYWPTAQQLDADTHVTPLRRLVSSVGVTLGELTIDQSICAAEASGMLSDAAGCCMLSGAGCWLANTGFARELAPLAVPGFLPRGASSPASGSEISPSRREGRSGKPLNPGNPVLGLLLKGSLCLLLRENLASWGIGTPGGN